MPRNAGGTYTLPAGNPVVAGTTIEDSWANGTLSDVATELTNSLDRTGKGSMTAALKLAAGALTTPSVTFNGDLNTGGWSPGPDIMAFSAGGVEAFRFTNSAVTFALALALTGGLTVDSPTFVVDATNNRVGIGTTVPDTQLTINANTVPFSGVIPTNTVLHILSPDASGARIVIDTIATNAVYQGRRANGTLAAPTTVLANENLVSWGGNGYDGTAWSSGFFGGIFLSAAENFSNTAHGTYMTFTTAAAGGITAAEKMRLTDTGLLGLGTTAPSQLLTLGSTTYAAAAVIRIHTDGAANNSPAITLRSTGVIEWTWGTNNSTGNLILAKNPVGFTGANLVSAQALVVDTSNNFLPGTNATQTLGATSSRWSTVFATALSDGADQLVSSSGTTVRLAAGAGWTAVNLLAGGASRVRVTSAGISGETDNIQSCGTAAIQWSDVRSVLGTFTGVISSSAAGAGFSQVSSNSGSANSLVIQNTSNTASSEAFIRIRTAGATAADSYLLVDNAVQTWALGLDNSASDAFVIAASAGLGTSNVLSISTAGAVSIPLGDFDVSRSSSGGTVSSLINNTSNTASSRSSIIIRVAGSTADDSFLQWDVSGVRTWTAGIDNSVANDPWVLAASSALGTTNVLSITSAGIVTIPGTLGVTTDFSVNGNTQLGTNSANTVTVSGLPGGQVEGNTYSPTFTAILNVDSVVALGTAKYIRIGTIGTVDGFCTIDVTAANTPTTIAISIPLVSNFTALTDGMGFIQQVTTATNPVTGTGTSSAANDRMSFDFRSGTVTTAETYYFHFKFIIL